MKCNAICMFNDTRFPHNCERFDVIELDVGGQCDCFVLADEADIYMKQATRVYEMSEKRRQNGKE